MVDLLCSIYPEDVLSQAELIRACTLVGYYPLVKDQGPHYSHMRSIPFSHSTAETWKGMIRLSMQSKRSLYCAATQYPCNVYRSYPKYWDTLTPYHTCPKILTSILCCLFMRLKRAGWVANSVDLDQTPQYLIWVFTVGTGMSVLILRGIIVYGEKWRLCANGKCFLTHAPYLVNYYFSNRLEFVIKQLHSQYMYSFICITFVMTIILIYLTNYANYMVSQLKK